MMTVRLTFDFPAAGLINRVQTLATELCALAAELPALDAELFAIDAKVRALVAELRSQAWTDAIPEWTHDPSARTTGPSLSVTPNTNEFICPLGSAFPDPDFTGILWPRDLVCIVADCWTLSLLWC